MLDAVWGWSPLAGAVGVLLEVEQEAPVRAAVRDAARRRGCSRAIVSRSIHAVGTTAVGTVPIQLEFPVDADGGDFVAHVGRGLADRDRMPDTPPTYVSG